MEKCVMLQKIEEMKIKSEEPFTCFLQLQMFLKS